MLDHHLRRGDAPQQLGADGAIADAVDELPRDRQRDIGFEQGDADLAQGRVDIRLAERATALQTVKDLARDDR